MHAMALPSLWHVRGRPGSALDSAGLPPLHAPRQYFCKSSIPSLTEVCSTMGESIQDCRLFPIQRSPRLSTSYKFAVPRYRLPCGLVRLSVEPSLNFNGIERSLSRAVVIKTSLCPSPLPHLQQRCLCTSHTMGASISTIQSSERISTSYKFAARKGRSVPPLLLHHTRTSTVDDRNV